jgi:PAS domain S-box-containing protein
MEALVSKAISPAVGPADVSNAYLEAALDYVVIADASGRVVEFNSAAARAFGYTRDEAVGRTLAELIVPPSLRARHEEAFARYVETGEETIFGRRIELTARRADGSEFPVELTLTRVAGEPLLVCGAIRDITERRRADRELLRLADEQVALRRVATLVAQRAGPTDVFAAVAEEAARVLDVTLISVVRYEPADSAVQVGVWGRENPFPVGTRWTLDDRSVSAQVFRTGRAARVDDYTVVGGEIAARLRDVGIRSAVGAPIVVDGRVWGVMMALSGASRPLADGTEARLAAFTELIATSISNTETRERLRRVAEEQAALRRVATLVARGASPAEVFAAVAEEAARVLDVPVVSVIRGDADRTATKIGTYGETPFPVGSRWTLDSDETVMAAVLESGEPARIDDYAQIPGTHAEQLADAGIRSGVGVPIIVDGRTWGVIVALSDERAPEDAEARLTDFTEIAATAISNAEARADLRRSEELYRRAISQAGAVPYVLDYGTGRYSFIGDGIEDLTGYRPDELTHELFGSLVQETYLQGEQSGLDNADAAHRTRAGEFERWRTDLLIRRRDGGRRWLSDASVEVLGDDGRSVGSIGMLQDITERMRAEEERLRLAALLEATTDVVALTDRDGKALYLNRAGRRLLGIGLQEDISDLRQSDLQPAWSVKRVLEEGIPTAIRDGVWSGENALLTRDEREIPVSQVIVAHKDATGEVTFLSGIARDMTEQRRLEARLRRTQEEQAALRRVATLVAREAPPTEVFDTVAAEVARVLEIPLTSILCYDVGETAVKVGGSGVENPYPVGARFPPHAGVITEVGRTGRPARVDDYGALPSEVAQRLAAAGIRSSVGVPIVVNGRTWGVMVALSTASDPLPADTEDRLADFTELVATAIANTEARAELRQLVDEQTALRRVATLVAGGADARGVFDAVCEETGRVIGATSVNLARFSSDGFNLTMAGWSLHDTHVPTGTRLPLRGETINTVIRRTRAPARVDSYDGVTGELAALIRERGIKSELGVPVIVEGEVWGALVAGWDTDELSPAGTELRLANFAELIATAVSNASNRAELIASRARIVASADEARRRIERDLHDGAQQQLVSLGLDLKALQMSLPQQLDGAHAEVERLCRALDALVKDVRQISQGVHPATLSQWGLGPAVRALARRSAVPVAVDADVPVRLPQSVEIACYYVVSEALANVAKHAKASSASVKLRVVDACLHATIYDDGVGGAEAGRGSGLTGLVDRVEALGGRLTLSSPTGGGTTIAVALPLAAPAGA